ncbi:MAG TPA: hypothetical protein VI168_15430, partial [Croceibacterium sp.]
SVIVEPSLPTSNFDEMLAANVARLDQAQDFVPYGDSGLFWPKASVSMFQLAAAQGTWDRGDLLPPGCRTASTQDGGRYHSCTFRLRRDGFEFSFSLNGENVSFADEYADFVRAKLDSWNAG